MAKLVNKAELSELIGISERSLTEWQKEGMPIHRLADERGQANEYEVAKVVAWMIQRELAKAQVRSPRDQLDAVRAQREQLGLRKDLGQLVERAEIRPLLERFVQDNVALIESIPEKYAVLLHQTADLEGKHELLKQLAREIRESLGNYEYCDAADPGGNQGVSPSA